MKKLLKSIIENNKSKVAVEDIILTISSIPGVGSLWSCRYCCLHRVNSCIDDLLGTFDCASVLGDNASFIVRYEKAITSDTREE